MPLPVPLATVVILTTVVDGTGESGKRVYRRADLIRLKMQDPARYDALSDEIMAAYAEGRVK